MLELINSSNNLTIQQEAEYHCTVSVNMSEDVSLIWKINDEKFYMDTSGKQTIENSNGSCFVNITYQAGVDTTSIIECNQSQIILVECGYVDDENNSISNTSKLYFQGMILN